MDTSTNTPQVFLSHASEDKDRFVIKFAEDLHGCGIDVWFDNWEILPGDSLVDKIFNEGLKNANAIIIVLSEASVSKPWVVEELNAAVVARISKGTKIIPIVLDDCDVPEALRSTVWIRIDDLSDFRPALERIVAAVFDHRVKPEVGPAPSYVQEAVLSVSGLNQLDNLIFKKSCEHHIKAGEYLVEPLRVFGTDSGLEVPDSELRDGLDVLENEGLIKVHHTMGPKLDHFEVSDYGWGIYFDLYVPDFELVFRNVVLLVLNEGLRDSDVIAKNIQKPQLYVDYIIDRLADNGHVMISKSLSTSKHIVHLNGSLKRLAED